MKMACIQLYSESSLGDFLLPLIFHEFQGKHGFWFDIQDVTGTTLSAKARFQINMNVPRIEGYTDLAKINTTVIPILWMEEGIDELGSELIGVLKQAVIDPQEWRQVIIMHVWLGTQKRCFWPSVYWDTCLQTTTLSPTCSTVVYLASTDVKVNKLTNCCPQVILYVWLGMVVTLVSLALVALARCILNRSKVERVREQVEHIIHSQLQHENHCQLIQPMLGEHSALQFKRDFAKHHSA